MKITIAGCGNMGLIYAKAFIKSKLVSAQELLLIEKNQDRVNQLERSGIGEFVSLKDSEIADSDVIIIAVKPQDFAGLASELRHALRSGQLVISIMAGIKISAICGAMGTGQVVRAMPNSAAELGMGMTAFAASGELGEKELEKAESLLSVTGPAIFLKDEEQLDAVTAVSGSGPAYFFYLVQHMIEAGKQMGFSEEVAGMLVKQTMLGSYHLMNRNKRSLDELIRTVASKGGTTEAALRVFESENIGKSLRRGIVRARDRARELSKN
jgi:pyrroline-5-carboxylate reductase